MRGSFLGVLCILVLVGTSAAQVKRLVEKTDQSSMTYTLVHPLHKIEATSKAVQYTVDVDMATKTIKHVTGVVDVTTFDSGNSNRDSHAMEVIDALTYPEANFTSSSIEQKGDSLLIQGKLTFHGVTRDVVARAREAWSQQNLEVNGGMDISLTAFKIERPSLMLIPVEDNLDFTFKAFFTLDGATDVSSLSK